MRFKCQMCGRCCRDRNLLVTITHRDLKRIADFLGYGPDELLDVIAFYKVEKRYWHRMKVPPVVTTEGLAHIGLLKMEDGACIFLSEDNRCLIYNARPMACRAFPFTFELREGWLYQGIAVAAREYCRGLGVGEEIRDEDLVRLGVQLLRELKEYTYIVRQWNRYARRGLITPSPRLLISYLLESVYEMEALANHFRRREYCSHYS